MGGEREALSPLTPLYPNASRMQKSHHFYPAYHTDLVDLVHPVFLYAARPVYTTGKSSTNCFR